MHCSKAVGMLLAARLSVPTCICREMQMPAWGAGEEPCSGTVSLRCWWPPASLTSGTTATFKPCHPRSSSLASARLGARQRLRQTRLQRRAQPVPTATHPSDPPMHLVPLLLPHSCFTHQELQHLKSLRIWNAGFLQHPHLGDSLC